MSSQRWRSRERISAAGLDPTRAYEGRSRLPHAPRARWRLRTRRIIWGSGGSRRHDGLASRHGAGRRAGAVLGILCDAEAAAPAHAAGEGAAIDIALGGCSGPEGVEPSAPLPRVRLGDGRMGRPPRLRRAPHPPRTDGAACARRRQRPRDEQAHAGATKGRLSSTSGWCDPEADDPCLEELATSAPISSPSPRRSSAAVVLGVAHRRHAARHADRRLRPGVPSPRTSARVPARHPCSQARSRPTTVQTHPPIPSTQRKSNEWAHRLLPTLLK